MKKCKSENGLSMYVSGERGGGGRKWGKNNAKPEIGGKRMKCLKGRRKEMKGKGEKKKEKERKGKK